MNEAVAGMTPIDERRLAAHHFEVSVTGGERHSMVRVSGPLDIQSTPQLLEKVLPLCGPGRRLVLDLRTADYVDSSGVRGMMEVEERLAADRGELRLVVQPGSRVERVLNLLHLTNRFHLYNSSSEAWQEKTPA